MNHRISFFFIAILMQYNLFAAITWDGMASAWSQGTGTESDPYLIETPQHLAYLAEIISGGITSYSGVYFKQMNDFDLAGRKWTPIGMTLSPNVTYYFSGHYDGNNKFVENISILPLIEHQGLFGIAKDATIVNLTTQGSCTYDLSLSVAGLTHGTILGSGLNVTLSNCFNKCNIVGDKTYDTGGIVGWLLSGTIANCINYGSVTGAICGGIVGKIGQVGAEVVINNCHNKGDINSTDHGGGLVGESVANSCEISMSSNIGKLTGTEDCTVLGGIAAYGDNYSITRCFNLGDVTSPKAKAGGILGSTQTSSSSPQQATISYCFARCKVRSTDSSSKGTWNLYGIGGGYPCSINNCYFVGTIYSARIQALNNLTNSHGDPIGNGNISDCFYNEDFQNRTTLNRGGMPKTKEVMRSTSFPQTINGTGEVVFVMDYDNVNEGYPIFGWQATTSSYLINGTCNSMEGTVAGGGTYASGSTATLSAYAAPDYAFLGWSDGSKENPRAVVVSEDATYTALFVRTAYTIRVGQDCQTSIE